MSLVPKAVRSMRIISLPLAKIRAHPDSESASSPNSLLVYYHFSLTSSNADEKNLTWLNKMLHALTTKAAEMWAGFGKAPEGSWKLRIHEYGERVVDRIDFEELALKSVDLSLAPSISNLDMAGRRLEKILERNDDKTKRRPPVIPLIYPPSVYVSPPMLASDVMGHPTLSHLRELLRTREPRHRRGFYLWMLAAPLTFPITIIPVIPNLPFFFCAWRSWSHYKAYRSSHYLSSLIEQGRVIPKPSDELDQLYKLPTLSPLGAKNVQPDSPVASCSVQKSASEGNYIFGPNPSLPSTGDANDDVDPSSHKLLLTRKAVPGILRLFELPESAAANLYRAIEQVRARLQRGL